MEFNHIPVLLDECLEGLNIRPDGIYCDGTAGGAGHSREIAKRLDGEKGGRLVAIDRDPEAVKTATERLAGYPATVVRGNYSEIDEIFERLGISGADGILMDLGVSSYQLDNAERGFSYHNDAPLDMRMSGEGLSAKDVVNGYDYLYDLAACLDMTQSAISHQLRILKANKLVKNRRDGKMMYYSLDDEHVKLIFEAGYSHIMEDKQYEI